jgi:hypothetical protein
MSNYDWDYNCAIVDRIFYWEYFLRGTTIAATVLSMKDLWMVRRNWYADRAMRRLPMVNIKIFYMIKNFIKIFVIIFINIIL